MISRDGTPKQSDVASEHDAFLIHESEDPISPNNQPFQSSHATKLRRSAYVLLLVLLYSAAALFAWTITCILSFRPLTANHYGAWIWNKENNGYGWVSSTNYHSLYIKNERWYRTARVIQSIVSVLTIPLTSTVCSSAAVVFVQHNRRSFGLSIRQVMTLADKGWLSPAIYMRILPLFTSRGWKQYGSSFLLLAIILNIFGGIISPMQELFLSTNTIKTPTWPEEVPSLFDFADKFTFNGGSDLHAVDGNLIPVMTRSALTSATNTQPQSQLWQGAGFTCNVLDLDVPVPPSCGKGATFGNISTLHDPFLAEIPDGFNTGLVRQFIPRINSTAEYMEISEGDYPTGCDDKPSAFFVDYSNITTLSQSYSQAWGLQACMPANLSVSPWKPTRERQDFTEELFLNVTLVNYEIGEDTGYNHAYYKVTVRTTGGYFELPNYMNNGVAGPLLDHDPNEVCGNDCEVEGDNMNFMPDI
jgi:hypothetical protein